MCDYSLMGMPNRLANSGEELVTHRFHTGAIGFISACENTKPATTKTKDLIEKIFGWLNQPQTECTAVCLPPGARLAVVSVPARLNTVFSAPGDSKQVTLTQISPGPGFRDAIRKQDGQEILLQKLQDGLRVRVLSLSSEEDSVPERQEVLHS